MKIVLVAGARPNFMKIAPVHRALKEAGHRLVLVHTGQHYDAAMSQLFFDQLGIPHPDENLEVGSGSHAVQTAEIMRRFEPLLLSHAPDLVMVVGDVNSTAACAMVAKKLPRIGVAHVEAGLRSFDRTMPEEINRLVTDALSDLLYTSERAGDVNLRAEGIPPERIVFAGNVMIDTLRTHLPGAQSTGAVTRHGLTARQYGLVTLHRPANVDDPQVFRPLMDLLGQVSVSMPILFPVHPRTRPAIDAWGAERGGLPVGLKIVAPLGYLEFLHLMSEARLVLTDSGGVQEETTVLGVPCLTMRENTERPVTVTEGTNTLVGRDPARIRIEIDAVLDGRAKVGRVPEGWDGNAAARIAEHLSRWDRVLR
ncbi:MAG: UDP-N-acetylglucosamine 2-epimerase (non-hydrolyzing) [Acidobacteriota bacterium]